MEIIRAEKMGFCFGVKEAVNLVNEIVEKNRGRNIYIIGMLVHNKIVIHQLEEKGVKTIEEENIDSLNEKDIVIVRAHGITKTIYEKLIQKKVELYDATCVFVKKSKKILIERQEEGFDVVLIGDKNHPEIKGIVSYGENVDVLADYEELIEHINKNNNRLCVLAQTTLNKNEYEKIKENLQKDSENAIIEDTICGATYERQKSVEKLAKTTDVVLVVGGKNSSNTKKLFNISSEINENTYFIETKDEIQSTWFIGEEKIGITAGTSTPEKSIKEVEDYLKSEFRK